MEGLKRQGHLVGQGWRLVGLGFERTRRQLGINQSLFPLLASVLLLDLSWGTCVSAPLKPRPAQYASTRIQYEAHLPRVWLVESLYHRLHSRAALKRLDT